MSDNVRDPVKIKIRLERDDEGWPPYDSESLWAIPLGNDLFKIDNIPWYALGLSAADVVRAKKDEDGSLMLQEVVTPSQHSTIRVIATDATADAMNDLLSTLNKVGCTYEGQDGFGSIIAVDIPPETDYGPIDSLLTDGEEKGKWFFEEGCLGCNHRRPN